MRILIKITIEFELMNNPGLYILSENKLRFNELQKRLPDITQVTLTKQLRTLEEYGIIIRTIYPQIPPKVEYELSDMGKDFSGVLNSLKICGDKYIDFYNTKNKFMSDSGTN